MNFTAAVVGKWILARVNPSLAESKFRPMILGVTVTTLIIALANFPLLPIGLLGGLLNLAVMLFGMGAIWLWGRGKFAGKPHTVSA